MVMLCSTKVTLDSELLEEPLPSETEDDSEEESVELFESITDDSLEKEDGEEDES